MKIPVNFGSKLDVRFTRIFAGVLYLVGLLLWGLSALFLIYGVYLTLSAWIMTLTSGPSSGFITLSPFLGAMIAWSCMIEALILGTILVFGAQLLRAQVELVLNSRLTFGSLQSMREAQIAREGAGLVEAESEDAE